MRQRTALLRYLVGFLVTLHQWLLPAWGQVTETGKSVGYPPLRIFDVEQGLPQAFVSGLVEDGDGFLWISTLGGLVRYDGHRMLPFPHRDTNPDSPLTDVLFELKQNGTDAIWIRGAGGIDRLNTRTGRCQHFPKLNNALRNLSLRGHLHVDRQGGLWGIIAKEGLFYFNATTNQVVRLRRATHGLLSDTICALSDDAQGHIIAITPTGLNRINTGGKVLQAVSFAKSPLGLRAMIAADFYPKTVKRPNGDILFNDLTQALLLDGRTYTIRSTPFPRQVAGDKPLWCKAANGQIYFVAGGILYSYSDQRELVPLWHYNTPGGTPLIATSLCVDRSGVLWLGADTKGLFRIDLAASPLQARHYNATFSADVLNEVMGMMPFQKNNPATEDLSYFLRTDYDRQHRLWIGVMNEIGCFDPETHAFTRLLTAGPSPFTHEREFLRGLSITPSGQIWAMSGTGIPFRYDSLTHTWKAPFGRVSPIANDLLVDDKSLFISTFDNNLYRLDLATRQRYIIRFDAQKNIASEHLLDLYQDPVHPDWLWIGSYNGLIGFNKRTHRYRRFTTANGLPDNTVYTILSDKEGCLWLSTNRGLCRFNPVTHTTLNFGLSDGLPGEEFNRFHDLKFPDGRLAFGGVKGWVLFDPAQIKADTASPTVAFTELSINNQPVDEFSSGSPLAQPLNHLSQLRLPHDQNYLTIDFTALHYHQPDRVTYRYQLLGYDSGWTINRRPTISYTQLPPGNYELWINAANASGQWSKQVRKLAIVVTPPFWASFWAYAFYTILLGSTVVGITRFRARRDRERQELVMSQRQADEMAQLDEAKMRFFANVSHELRTPLTLLLGPLSTVSSRHYLENQDKEMLQTADRSARQLLSLVNELLDLTKLEAGKLVLYPQAVRIQTLLQDCLAPFMQQAQQMGLSLLLEHTCADDLVVRFDVGKVRQVIQNLLANAIRFTPSGGSVQVWVNCEQDQLKLQVRDTGRGIHPDDLPHVFDRYFQTSQPGAPLEGGTGIGLALCQELVRLMQGTISAESTLGKGSSFTVTLPLVADCPLDTQDTVLSTHERVSNGFTPDPAASEPADGNLSSFDDTLLLVEDNADLRAYLTLLLSPTMRVITAANGRAALNLLDGLPSLPSLLISDLMMPVMDGFQLLEALKAHPTYRTIPVVVLTARTDVADKLRALRLGVDDYLLKPFSEPELMARVISLLHNQRERNWQAVADPVTVSATETHTVSSTDEATPPVSADDLVWLECLEQLTLAHLDHFDLTAEALADALHMSRRSFFRSIKRLTGLTPAQYISEARFRQARQLLENRQVSSVKQVAHRVGFRHVNHFAQTYQQHYGKAPSAYF